MECIVKSSSQPAAAINAAPWGRGAPSRCGSFVWTDNNSSHAMHPFRDFATPTTDDILLKLLSIVDGDFEAPGLTDSKAFRYAVHRQQLITHRHHLAIIYDSESPGSTTGAYTRVVPDWDALMDAVFHVRWWSSGLKHFSQWHRDLHLWTYEELQDAHRDHLPGTAGPRHPDWCQTDGVTNWDMFWSAALLYRFTATTGVKSWDTQFNALGQKQ